MADVKRYYDVPSPERLEGTVIGTGGLDGRPWARLEETIFYPEGGGQPADHGRIGEASVLDVQARDGAILHFTDRPVSPGSAPLSLDVVRRFDHCQQHTAQHLLTAVLLDRHRLATTSFHLGAEYTAIEVKGPAPGLADLARFEREVNDLVREDRPVTARWIAPEELATSGVRTRGLPEGHAGPVRLVEIAGIDLNTCGGTHVARLGEIQVVEIVDAEPARGGTRIRFLAGGRVLAASQRRRSVEEAVKARLGTAREGFADTLDAWTSERRRQERRIRELEGELAERIAVDLATEPGRLVRAVRPGSGAEALRAIAGAVLTRRPEAVVVLCGDSGEPREACFIVQAGDQGPADVSRLGALVRELLGARGGGKGRLFQGKGGHLVDPSSLARATGEGA